MGCACQLLSPKGLIKLFLFLRNNVPWYFWNDILMSNPFGLLIYISTCSGMMWIEQALAGSFSILIFKLAIAVWCSSHILRILISIYIYCIALFKNFFYFPEISFSIHISGSCFFSFMNVINRPDRGEKIIVLNFVSK